MYSRFVRPELVTIEISHDDRLVVKRRLTHGERVDAYQRMYLAGVDGKIRTNPITASMAMVIAYLVDWTLTDPDGAAVPVKGLTAEELEAILRNLDPSDFTEIKDAIEAHEVRETMARDLEKKTSDGGPPSKPISESRSGVDGGMSGLAH